MQKQPLSSLSEQDHLLVRQAQEATHLAYAPYSHFHVGAAVQLADGTTVQGGNQENASYPCGICAERSALATAQNLHPGVPVTAIAIAATRDGSPAAEPVTPCGMCRQVIAETEQRYATPIRIIMASQSDAVIADTIADLLPLTFKKML